MPEPECGFVKDADGYRWFKDEHGWTLYLHEFMPCYVNIDWNKVEEDYGPLQLDLSYA